MRQSTPLASRALVATAFALIALVAGAHFRWFLPRATFSSSHSVLSVFLLLEILALFTLAATSDPGFVANDTHRYTEEVATEEGAMMLAGPVQQCAKCAAEKPRRAHHCRVCDRCVREMDHHCVWLSNCVGVGNYRKYEGTETMIAEVAVLTGCMCMLVFA